MLCDHVLQFIELLLGVIVVAVNSVQKLSLRFASVAAPSLSSSAPVSSTTSAASPGQASSSSSADSAVSVESVLKDLGLEESAVSSLSTLLKYVPIPADRLQSVLLMLKRASSEQRATVVAKLQALAQSAATNPAQMQIALQSFIIAISGSSGAASASSSQSVAPLPPSSSSPSKPIAKKSSAKLEHFTKLSSTSLDRQLAHIVAAECLAGVWRALSHQTADSRVKTNEILKSLMQTLDTVGLNGVIFRFLHLIFLLMFIIHQAISTCGVETIDFWNVALRFVATRQDPRRVSELLNWVQKLLSGFDSKEALETNSSEKANSSSSTSSEIPLGFDSSSTKLSASSSHLLSALDTHKAVVINTGLWIELGLKSDWMTVASSSSSQVAAWAASWWHALRHTMHSPTPDGWQSFSFSF